MQDAVFAEMGLRVEGQVVTGPIRVTALRLFSQPFARRSGPTKLFTVPGMPLAGIVSMIPFPMDL